MSLALANYSHLFLNYDLLFVLLIYLLALIADVFHFVQQVEAEGKPVTNQRSSGRCWLFATLNVMRIPFCKSLNIDEFEFSQAHLFFWDKVRLCIMQ